MMISIRAYKLQEKCISMKPILACTLNCDDDPHEDRL